MPKPANIFLILPLLLEVACGQAVFINEIHYDNNGNDENEGVEIAGPAGTDLIPYKLVFYNGANGLSYQELPLGGTLPAQNGTAFGTAFFPRAGIQNGPADGIALIDTVANSVVQFLSYEGTFTAADGDASGESSTDIGVAETGSTPATHSVQLVGNGAVYSDFSWQSPAAASPAMINSGQMFIGAGMPGITLTLMPASLDEGTDTAATISLFPAPPNPVTISIHNPDPSELSTPPSIQIPTSGSASFSISALDDSLNDGNQSVILTASDPAEFYDPNSTTALVRDVQRPARGTAIRLATVNAFDGVGARGSPEYAALLTIIGRIEPDVVAFQEISSAGDFFDLKNLLADLGMPHLATSGEAFLGDAYEGGRFTTDQNVAIASIYPIIRDNSCPKGEPWLCSPYQIDRGENQRKEFTRFPLLVEIDVPGTNNDPTIVAVHFKASSNDASRFRKAVEAYRTIRGIAAAGHDASNENIFVLGDFNEDHDRFMPNSFNTNNLNFSDPSLPATYDLGDDISGANAITLPYAQFPDKIFGDAAFVTPFHRQQDGSGSRTFNTFGDAALDYILHSQRVAQNGNVNTEIYNSSLDRAFDGLAKQALPTPPATSFLASDHFVVFGDYELDPKPKLSLAITPFAHDEDAGAAAATGILTLSQPPAAPLSVQLAKLRVDAPIHLPLQTITVDPGETQITFPIDIVDRATADVDHTSTITASADGYSSASDTLLIRNLDPSGRILISQYTEPPTGSAPRGLELFNCGPTDIDLAGEPIRVIQYTNGSTSGNIEAVAESGILPAGGVLVIGDAICGDYLVSQGLLPMPDAPFSAAENGTPYLNAAGEIVFVKEFFPYNGDDAIEVQFAYGLSDVFGTVGQDPGSAWQSGGVSTSGRNLSLRDEIGTASAGFTQPHLRFSDIAAGNDLVGFGTPPAADDPFKIWLLSFGLDDPNADSDFDRLDNVLEFATGSDPTDPGSGNPPLIGGSNFSHRQLAVPGRLTYTVEVSDDLLSWSPATPADLTQIGTTPNSDGTETITYSYTAGVRRFLRLRVTLQ